MSNDAPHFGRRSLTKGMSSAQVEQLLKARREAEKKSAEGMEKYIRAKVKKKVDEKLGTTTEYI